MPMADGTRNRQSYALRAMKATLQRHTPNSLPPLAYPASLDRQNSMRVVTSPTDYHMCFCYRQWALARSADR